MLHSVIDFLNEIKERRYCYFIEAEAIPRRMMSFIDKYNSSHSPTINENSEGIICLQEDANKWGLELRLYVPIVPPRAIEHLFTRTSVYRGEFPYRLNDNDIIEALFDRGCKIGLN